MAGIEEEGIKKLVLDLLRWESYSSLQKLSVLFIAACILSWCSSFWTVIIIYCISFVAGFKLSEQALHHEKTSLIAEQVLDKLESVYLQVRSHCYKIKAFLTQLANEKEGLSSSSVEVKIEDSEPASQSDETSKIYSNASMPITLPNNVGQELNSIQLLILRDFIRSWYADYSYDPQFLKDTKLLLQQTFNNFVSRVAQQDPQATLTQVINLFMIHLSNYQKARNSFQSHKVHPNTKVVTGSAIQRHSSVDKAFESLSAFHCALESEKLEQEYLKGVVSLFVVCTCNSQVITGVCARTLLVDILSQNIVLPVIQMMSDPDWLMNIIIRITSYEEKETGPVHGGETKIHDEVVPQTDKLSESTVAEKGSCRSTEDQESSDMNSKRDYDTPVIKDSENAKKLMRSDTFHSCHENSEDLSEETLSAENQGETEKDKVERSAVEKLSESLSVTSSLKSVADTFTDHETEKSSTSDKLDGDTGSSVKEMSKIMKGEISELSANHISEDLIKSNDVKHLHSDRLSSHMSEADVGTEALKHFNGDDYDVNAIKFDPQKIINFSSSQQPSESNDVDSISVSNFSETDSEHSSHTFPKLSSLRHFFVDTLKPGGKQQHQQQQGPQVVKKPKTLSIISGFTSNLNPLSSKNAKASSDFEKSNSSTTPKLLVDGVPIKREASSASNLSEMSASVDKEEEPQLTPALSDCDTSPAPGFFSNINSLFSFSSRGTNSESGLDTNSVSPLVTPSPTAKDAPPTSNQDLNSVEVNNGWADMVKTYVLDDGRIFQDVSIPETSVNTEYRSSTQYSLYVIQYEALYFSEEGKSIIRSGTVRRRYREFLSLQSRLESQVPYKQFMKKIRGPKRWPTLPFKSIDKETVEARRLFLEKYLKDLIEIEAICNGPDIREFLAYEGDSHIAFVKKSPEINVPRLDKMLMRGVSGVVDRIMSIPNNAQEVISGLRSREIPEDRLSKPVAQYDVDMFEISHDFGESEGLQSSCLLWESCATTMEDSCSEAEEDLFNISKVLTDQKTTDKMEMVYRQEVEKILASLPSLKSEVSDSPENPVTSDSSEPLPEERQDQSHESLGSAVIDLLVQGLQGTDHWLSHDRVVQSLQAVLGKALNRYLASAVSDLVSQEEIAFYLLTLRETIWPHGQLGTDSSTVPETTTSSTADTVTAISEEDGSSLTEAEREERKSSEAKAKAGRAVGSMFPESVKLAIGKSEFENLINVFLDSLQSEQLNRNLVYHILDQLLENLFPEVTTFDLIHDLLFSSLSSTLTMPRLVKEAEKL